MSRSGVARARREADAAALAARSYDGLDEISLPQPDYDAVDVMVVRRPDQLKALADDLRARVVVLLRERAQSTTEIAQRLALPKGTVAYHLKVLQKAGLIKVVRTRKVRAVTERYYGRTARLFLFKSSDDADGGGVRDVAAASLRTVAEEMLPSADDDRTSFAVLRARLTPDDARRFARRLNRLQREFIAADNAAGEPFGVALALFRRAADA
ncbi:MAG TPA: winged helix-turn-helix domain-containing protein [Gaiellaceae bacterium]|nr:winged helix-turn-helix domain-containing protein [Gaiellaceae bacterium]